MYTLMFIQNFTWPRNFRYLFVFNRQNMPHCTFIPSKTSKRHPCSESEAMKMGKGFPFLVPRPDRVRPLLSNFVRGPSAFSGELRLPLVKLAELKRKTMGIYLCPSFCTPRGVQKKGHRYMPFFLYRTRPARSCEARRNRPKLRSKNEPVPSCFATSAGSFLLRNFGPVPSSFCPLAGYPGKLRTEVFCSQFSGAARAPSFLLPEINHGTCNDRNGAPYGELCRPEGTVRSCEARTNRFVLASQLRPVPSGRFVLTSQLRPVPSCFATSGRFVLAPQLRAGPFRFFSGNALCFYCFGDKKRTPGVFFSYLRSNKSTKHSLKKTWEGLTRTLNRSGTPKAGNLISMEYSLDNFHRSNQDTCLVHKPSVFEGQWVQSGDLLADCSASVGGELALGQNILIAYMPWEGYNFEDAILVSERLVYDDLYTSVHIERYEVELRETKLGFEEITREIPDVMEGSVSHLNNLGIAKLGSWVEEGDILVGKVTPISTKKQSNYQKLLYTILDKTVLPLRDSSLRAPKGIKAKVIGIQIFKSSSAPSRPEGTGRSCEARTNRYPFKESQDIPLLRASSPGSEGPPLSTFLSSAKLPWNICRRFSTEKPFGVPSFPPKKDPSGPENREQNTSVLDFPGLRKELQKKKIKRREFLPPPNLFGAALTFGDPGKSRTEVFCSRFSGAEGAPSGNEAKKENNGHIPKPFFLPAVSPRGGNIPGLSHPVPTGPGLSHPVPTASGSYRVGGYRVPSYCKYDKSSSLVSSRFILTSLIRVLSEKNPTSLKASRSDFLRRKSKSSGCLPATPSPESGPRGSFLRILEFTPKGPFFLTSLGVATQAKKSKKEKLYGTLKEACKKESALDTTLKGRASSYRAGFSVPSFLSFSTTLRKEPQTGSISSIQIYLAEKRRIQVGDKMSGRHGNKGIISQIIPVEDMPFLPDGRELDMVLNPLGVPSRMNVGQIFECLLGLAGKYLGENFKVFPFDEIYGAEASRSFVYSKLYKARSKTGKQWLFNQNSPGKIRLYDGRTGETFDQAITVGYAYMLRLVHMVDDKIHARSTGPYSLVTQQPLRGRSKQGGQRLGEMEVWAFEGYGAAFTLLEMLTIKSDDMTGRMTLWSNLILNKEISIGTPESFKVLICELQALCLDIGLFRMD